MNYWRLYRDTFDGRRQGERAGEAEEREDDSSVVVAAGEAQDKKKLATPPPNSTSWPKHPAIELLHPFIPSFAITQSVAALERRHLIGRR